MELYPEIPVRTSSFTPTPSSSTASPSTGTGGTGTCSALLLPQPGFIHFRPIKKALITRVFKQWCQGTLHLNKTSCFTSLWEVPCHWHQPRYVQSSLNLADTSETSLERRLAGTQQTEVKDSGLASEHEPGRKRLHSAEESRERTAPALSKGSERRSKPSGTAPHTRGSRPGDGASEVPRLQPPSTHPLPSQGIFSPDQKPMETRRSSQQPQELREQGSATVLVH